MLRVIAGELRGRRLRTPSGRTTRPTADRTREAVFNILGARLLGGWVLDLFAGSGAFGIEALSRGAAGAVFVENDRRAFAVLQRNLADLGLLGRSRAFLRDAARGLGFLAGEGFRFRIAFLDPPYGAGLVVPALQGLLAAACMDPGGLIVVEHSAGEGLPETVASLRRSDRRRYGDTLVSFYSSVL
ncbi:MAG: 16S rRNA (guanine(966)-N(2))-methyltransferase RsmD [Desulfobacterales bacterium]